MKILVVEDDYSIRETLGMVLQAYQHHVDLLDNGETVVPHLKTSWPDVMLLDLTLQGMTGEEVYCCIQAEFGRVPPTIVLSAARPGESRAKLLPGTRFLGKPCDLDELQEMIEQVGGGVSQDIEKSKPRC